MMIKTNYKVNFYIDWNDETASTRTLTFRTKSLLEVFDQLYEKTVLDSILDAELYSPSMINEINIVIRKKPEKETGTRNKKVPIKSPDLILKLNSDRDPNVKYDLRFSLKYKGTTLGSLDFVHENLKEVFDQLYTEVVESSIIDPITDKITGAPEMLNDIHITITKKRVKWIKK